MYELIENWSVVFIMVFILIISIQLSINSPKNIGIRLVNVFLSVLILAGTFFVAQNKYITEREAQLKAEMSFKENSQASSEEVVSEAKTLEKNSIEKKMLYKKEKKFLLESIEKAIASLKEIEAIGEDQYNTIYEEDFLFNKYRKKSNAASSKVNTLYNSVKKYKFHSKLSLKKSTIVSAFAKTKKAASIYKKVFFNEQDVAYPKMVPSARKAKLDLIDLKSLTE